MLRNLTTKDEGAANVALFGVAFDGNCSIENGASMAPKCIRECSEYLPPFTVTGKELTAKIFDYGDVTAFNENEVDAILEKALKKKFTLVLGGDHSVSILTQKAFKKKTRGKVGIIHIDAHADICDTYQGSLYSHACVNRRALENGYCQEDITMLGIRSFEKQEAEFLSKSQIALYTTEKILDCGTDTVVNELSQKYKDYDAVYLSFDIDAIDPAYAPGTGTPEAFGLTPRQVLKIILGLMKELPILIMDIVEVSPPLDTNKITAWLALKYIIEILYAIEGE